MGGTLKKFSAKAILQGPMKDQILRPADFFNFYNDMTTSVTMTFLSHEQIKHCRSTIKDLYEIAEIVPVTKIFHHSLPL